MHICIYGNPCDGFRFVGPFDDIDDARRYIEGEAQSANWWIAELDIPAGEGEDRTEWSGHPDPANPDNFWIDDKTGERVDAHTATRREGR